MVLCPRSKAGKQGMFPGGAGVALVANTPGDPPGVPVMTEPDPWVL